MIRGLGLGRGDGVIMVADMELRGFCFSQYMRWGADGMGVRIVRKTEFHVVG